MMVTKCGTLAALHVPVPKTMATTIIVNVIIAVIATRGPSDVDFQPVCAAVRRANS